MIAALHVHTNYSACSESRIEDIAAYCRRNDIDAIAITDHDVIEGALALQEYAPHLKVIIGEEISTRQGEVIGLFLNKRIDPDQDIVETCLEIKRQRGLVYIPHPFDKFKIHRVKKLALERIIDLVDIIEVFNAKISLPAYNARALHRAERYGKVGAAGSDSHYIASIGNALVEMEDFYGPEEFLDKLSKAEFKTKPSGPLPTWWVRVRKRLEVVRRWQIADHHLSR